MRFFRFFAVGGISTILDYGIYAVLVFMGFHYVGATVLGYTAGFVLNFFLVRRVVFNESRMDCFKKELSAVGLIVLGGLALNILIVYLLYEALGVLNQMYARVIAIIIVFLYNYEARRRFVYH